MHYPCKPLTPLALAAMFVACEPEIPVGPAPELEIGPQCQLGCVDPDPNPEAPGIFLGSGVTPWECFNGGHTDRDVDGLSDFCEAQLTSAFRPQLTFWQFDELGREPYWAARPTGTQWDPIRILYLLAYHRDAGSGAWLCTSQPFPHWSCFGHNGDSEWILIDVFYNDETEHWATDVIALSRHGQYGIAARQSGETYAVRAYAGGYFLYAVEYPQHPGRHPRVYVSEGKHANYFTAGECNSGGVFGTDTCEHVSAVARLEWSTLYNVGSRSTRLVNCVVTRSPSHPYYGSGRRECFWVNQPFRGWYPAYVGGAEAGPYEPILADLGF